MSGLIEVTVKISEQEEKLVNEYLSLRRANDAAHADHVGDAILIGTALMEGIRDRIKLYASKEAA